MAEKANKKKTVTIQMNGTPFVLPKDEMTVAELKTATGAPQAHEVAQIIHGRPVPLADGAEVKLKEGDEYLSYPRDSAAS